MINADPIRHLNLICDNVCHILTAGRSPLDARECLIPIRPKHQAAIRYQTLYSQFTLHKIHPSHIGLKYKLHLSENFDNC